jgi:hypothetical protein
MASQDRLAFRSESVGPALAKAAQHAERSIRQLAQEPRA